ncbi:hypothetical protein IGJ93_000462 [Enterococcus sp. DIV0174]
MGDLLLNLFLVVKFIFVLLVFIVLVLSIIYLVKKIKDK